jgi:hypothetical protein
MKRIVAGGALFVAVVLAIAPAAAAAAWFDAKPVVQWNSAGARIPRASSSIDRGTLARCGAQLRTPASPEDRAVTAAGWRLFESYKVFNGTSIVVGLSGFDGMCRPTGYQGFVFINAAFAGTISPKPMDSRTDGALENVELFSANTITASFLRYKDSDPLCCASATSFVTYAVKRGPGAARLTVSDVSTTPNASR